MLQGLLLERQRIAAAPATQLLFGQLHQGGRSLSFHANPGEHRVARREAALLEACGQLRHVGAQPPFGDRECGDVFATLLGSGAAAVAQPVEGGGYQFLLPSHETFRRLALRTTAPAAATLLLGLAIILRERTHFQEVHIAAAGVSRSILGHGVVCHKVARHQRHLLQEHRVRRARVARTTRRAVLHHDALLSATVHAIAQLERHHAQVVAGLHGHGDFIGIRGLGVAPRLLDGHTRAAVGNRIDHILYRAGYGGAVGGDQIHVVEATLRHFEATGHRTVTFDRHRHRGAIVEAQYATGDFARDRGVHHHRGAHDRRDITTVFHMFGGHAAVRREAEVERYVRNGRQVVHRERVGRRPHVGRFHVVLGGLGDVEQARTEARRIGFGAHWQSLPLAGRVTAEYQFRPIGGETHQRRVHFNGTATRHCRVAGFDTERAHRHRCFGRTKGHE